MDSVLDSAGSFFKGKAEMMIRPWSRTVLKVVIMAAAMCSGVVAYAQPGLLERDEGKDRADPQQDRHDRRADRQEF